MIRTLAVNCAPNHIWSKDDWKTVTETASDEMVMGAVRALCQFSVLGSPQNLADPCLTALDNVLKQFYKKKGTFQEQNMSKSAKAQVDEQLAGDSCLLQEQKIHKICAAIEVQVYGVEKVTMTKPRIFQVHLNRRHRAATKRSDADQQSAKERLGQEIHQVTSVKCQHFDELFQYHKRQLLQEVGTKATNLRSTLAKKLTQ